MERVEIREGVPDRDENAREAGQSKFPRKIELEKAKRPPEGTIESLLPLVEGAYAIFPNLLSPERSFWVGLKEQAKFDFEDAITRLRRARYSAEDTTNEVLDRLLTISGIWPSDKEKAKDAMFGWLNFEINSLYISTTEVTGSKK